MSTAESGAATCWIITVGDELINGTRVDTNTAWLSRRLAEIGVRVVRAISVGDREEAIRDSISRGMAGAEVVIVGGGLGPTHDDRTKEAVAAHFGAGMRRSGEVEKAVRRFFEERGRALGRVNLDQALVPEGFEYRINPLGTAPGLLKRLENGFLFVLPGVPAELRALYDDLVEPVLKEAYGGRWLVERRWFSTAGIGESDLFDRVGGLEEMSPDVSIAYLPSANGTAIYLTGEGMSPEEVGRLLDEAERRVRQGAGDYLYAGGDRSLADHIAGLLTERGETLATAESCTGGQIAHLLTNVPGASNWFLRGWVVYSNESKEEELGVPHELLVEHGAVSGPVARAMAEGARRVAGTDYALSVTGIAGPAGGTAEKPVGLVYTGCAGPDRTIVRRFLLGAAGRRFTKRRAAANALDLLRRMIEGLTLDAGEREDPE